LKSLSYYEDLFYDLRTGIANNHERPHKPALLLAVIDLIGSKVVTGNLIPFSRSLRDRFTEYFSIVASPRDRNSPDLPFWHLKSEPFWHHLATPQNEQSLSALQRSPTIGQINQLIAGAHLDDELYLLLQDPLNRNVMRDVLISRYFPGHRLELFKLSGSEPPKIADSGGVGHRDPGRTAGFRRTIISVYEHQCAACGLRIRMNGIGSIVEAAHLIPFTSSFDDHPRNGMALCKNHHWALDSHLIAPGPDHCWHVSGGLDDRQPGERELIALSGRSLILPKEETYHPRLDALEWRIQRLWGVTGS
jgi:putative restriction endonuclease